MPPLCEDRLEVLVVWEAAVAHNDASSYVSQQMMANDVMPSFAMRVH